jgi:hypothetical protein
MHPYNEGFPTVPRESWVAPWFGRAQCDKQTRGVSQCGLAIYIKKYLKAKEELWKLKYFNMQKYNLQKIL